MAAGVMAAGDEECRALDRSPVQLAYRFGEVCLFQVVEPDR